MVVCMILSASGVEFEHCPDNLTTFTALKSVRSVFLYKMTADPKTSVAYNQVVNLSLFSLGVSPLAYGRCDSGTDAQKDTPS